MMIHLAVFDGAGECLKRGALQPSDKMPPCLHFVLASQPEPKLREGMGRTWHHLASQWQRQNLNPGLPTPRPELS